MYQPQDYADNRAQLRARLLAAGVPASALLVLTFVSFFLRWPQPVTMLLSIAACAVFIFCQAEMIAPVAAYGKHIDHALNGRTHDTRGVFAGFEAEPVIRDGLLFYPLTINVGATLRENGDRLFYYDAHLPLPDWREGETVVLTSYDNRVTAWSRAQ